MAKAKPKAKVVKRVAVDKKILKKVEKSTKVPRSKVVPKVNKMDLLDVLNSKIMILEAQFTTRYRTLMTEAGELRQQCKQFMEGTLTQSANHGLQFDDLSQSLNNKYLNLYQTMMEYLAKQPDAEPEFANQRLLALEQQMKALQSKVAELLPELN